MQKVALKKAFRATTETETFGVKVFSLLVENFSQTFFVGGFVRDMLLQKPITDIDIATEATPEEAALCLSGNGISVGEQHRSFGVLTASGRGQKAEVATFRTEWYRGSRYPDITLTTDVAADAQRRDFTVNSLYFSAKTNTILNFFDGMSDVEKKIIRFVGDPKQKLFEDPLRAVRAVRFCLELGFTLAPETHAAIENIFPLVGKKRFVTELEKISSEKNRTLAKKIILGEKSLDMLTTAR
jgi:tRNA nucleotidyltransferase/poly(A) polymerase